MVVVGGIERWWLVESELQFYRILEVLRFLNTYVLVYIH